jgi:ADP-ribose pyrophosphatase YjhB (NUDIX family)
LPDNGFKNTSYIQHKTMHHRIRVAGLIYRADEILLIQQQDRHGVRNWSIPGGRLESTDADIFRGVEREVWEETGLKVEARQLRFVSEYLAPDIIALTLIIECHLANDEHPDNIHLDNIMDDDNIHGVAWWPISRIRTSDEPMSQILTKQAFWDALEQAEGMVYLGRHHDV